MHSVVISNNGIVNKDGYFKEITAMYGCKLQISVNYALPIYPLVLSLVVT